MTLQLTAPEPKYLPSVRAAIAEYAAAPSELEIHAVRKMIDAAQTDFTSYFETVRIFQAENHTEFSYLVESS